MGYHYDPILCMNVPDSTSKAKDASWKAWTLYIDGKWVKSFNSSMAPIKEAQKFMKENYPGKVGKLVRNTGSSSGYSISGNEYKDAAPVGVRDANKKEGFVIHSAQIKGNKIAVVIEDLLYSPGKKEIEEFTKEEAKKLKNDPWTTWKGSTKSMLEKFISSAKDAKALDKAIMTTDEEKVVGYREISMETRRAKVGDVEVYMGDSGSEIVDFTVNWPSIGYVSPDKALSFARDLMKAASNAKKLEQKYKGYKIKF